MIKEIAVDPELFCQWQHHLTLRNAFAVEKGRLIAGFPKKWKGLVREVTERMEAANELGSVKAETIRNWLNVESGQKDTRLVASAASFDGNKAWHLNAEDQASNFDAILSHQSIDVPNALLADDDRSYFEDERFIGRTQCTVTRRKLPIIDCVWPLLKEATQVRIVEPHFNPKIPRFLKVLEALLDRLVKEKSNVRTVELHVRNPNDKSPDDVKPPSFTVSELCQKLQPLLRTGWSLKVFLWTRGREKMHPRYLLTDRGGLQIDHGWDEGELDTDTTPVVLLEQHRWKQEMERYREGTMDFEMTPNSDVIIVS